MTILQSILLCLSASPDGVEVWSPGRGRFHVLGTYRDPVIGRTIQLNNGSRDYSFDIETFRLEDFKLIRKSFADLVGEVKAKPGDNAATRAFKALNGYVKGAFIRVWIDEIDNIQINPDFEMSPNGNFFFNYQWSVNRLLSEGYAPGIPSEHCITLKEITQ